MDALIRLRLLGPIELLRADATPANSVLAQPKRLALLAYLTLARPHGAPRRDELLTVFWPRADPSRARNALRQALHYLRQSLGTDSILSHDDDTVAVNLESLWVDALEFERLARQGDSPSALELYRGHLLDGMDATISVEFEHWLDGLRTRLANQAWTLAFRSAEQAEEQGDPEEAIRMARRAVGLRPVNEDSARVLMRLLSEHGDRVGALEAYDSVARNLFELFEAAPEAETEALAEAIRRAPGDVSDQPHRQASSPGRPVSPSARFPDPSSVERQPPRARRRLVALGFAAGIAVAWGIGLLVRSSTTNGSRLDLKAARVIVADFDATPGDEDLATAVTWALKTDLHRSELVSLATDVAVANTLERMSANTGGRWTPRVAREVAVRNGYAAVVEGEVASAGAGWILTARVVTPDSAIVLHAEREMVADSTDVVPGVSRIVERLRAEMGESLRTIRSQPPLPELTTHSLAALKAVARGWKAYDTGKGSPGGFFVEALDADSTFAAARVAYGVWLYFNAGRPADGAAELRRAYARKDRLTPGEATDLIWAYHTVVTGDHGTAARAVEKHLEHRPEQRPDYQWSLILNAMQTNDFERAKALLLQLREITGDLNPPMTWNLVGTLLMLGDAEEVDAELDDVALTDLRRRVALVRESWETVEYLVEGGELPPVTVAENRMLVALARGRLGEFRLWSGRLRSHLESASRDAAAERSRLAFDASVARDLLNDTAAALALTDSAAGWFEANAPDKVPHAALVEQYARSGQPEKARGHLRELERSQDRGSFQAQVEAKALAEAWLLLAESRPRDALHRLQEVPPHRRRGHGIHRALAAAYEQASLLDSAVVHLEAVLDDRWIFGQNAETRTPHLAVTRGRLVQLYGRLGRTSEGAPEAERVLGDWGEADPVLQPRIDALRSLLDRRESSIHPRIGSSNGVARSGEGKGKRLLRPNE
jgi:DNA-binding SARP family transcriptional activator/TolB-like protein